MRTKLKSLLIASIFALASAQCVFANGSGDVLTATQPVTSTLGPIKKVVTNGGNINATIDETTGALSAALTPAFKLTTNIGDGVPVKLTAESNTTGGVQNALFGTGATGSTFIILTNSTVLPSVIAFNDAAAPAPTPAVNANAIAYPVEKPADVPGQLTYVWDAGNIRWNGNLTHTGDTNTLLTIPATTPRASTFSIEDESGSYQSTVTLSFV